MLKPFFLSVILICASLMLPLPCSASRLTFMLDNIHLGRSPYLAPAINDHGLKGIVTNKTKFQELSKKDNSFLIRRYNHSTFQPEVNNKVDISQCRIEIFDKLTTEMDHLRLLCFPGSNSFSTSRDEFDARSKHITILNKDNIIAYARITPGPNSIFENWTLGKAVIPTGNDVLDLGRCLVHPLYRGNKLFEVLCLQSMQYAQEQGFNYIVGTYIPNHSAGRSLHKIGFLDCGFPVFEDETTEKNVWVQPVAYKVPTATIPWQELINAYLIKDKTINTNDRDFLSPYFKKLSSYKHDIDHPYLRLRGKTALITGAASGIGRVTAELFIKHGAQVVLADIDDRQGIDAVLSIGARALYTHLDVSKEEEWQRTISQIKQQYGRLDVLVNNAGISGFLKSLGPQDPEQYSLESWRKVHSINIDGTFLGCKHAIPLLKESGGALVNVSSRSGNIGVPGAVAYASSKAAVRNHTKSVALYCAQNNYNIRCNSVHPGAIHTQMWDPVLKSGANEEGLLQKVTEQIPLKRMGRPEDVAYGILYLASDESKYVTGTELIIDGGILAGAGPMISSTNE